MRARVHCRHRTTPLGIRLLRVVRTKLGSLPSVAQIKIKIQLIKN
jgi:hypothetical protein